MSVRPPIHAWVRQYLTSLLEDPTLQPRAGHQALWLEQQSDPSARAYGFSESQTNASVHRVSIQQALGRDRKLILIGDAGRGKTQSLRRLVREYAQDALASPQAPIPLYLPLQTFAGSIKGTLTAQAKFVAPDIAELVAHRPCILLVDALNDLAPGDQFAALAELRHALNTLEAGDRWIVTCRTESWHLFETWFKDRPVWRICPLLDGQVRAVVESLPPAIDRLLKIPGTYALARSVRWLDALGRLNLRAGDDLPGPLLVAWLQSVAAEAAATHCLDYAPDLLLPFLERLVEHVQQRGVVARADLRALVSDATLNSGQAAAEFLTLIEALGLLETSTGERFTLRSPVIRDLALATTEQLSTLALRTEPTALALRFGLVNGDQMVVELLRAGDWRALQGLLDQNLDAATIIGSFTELSLGEMTGLGRVWAQHGSRKVAIHFLEQAVRNGRDDAQLWYMLGQLHVQDGELGLAQSALTKALELDPTNTVYGQALADVYYALGMPEEARRIMTEVYEALHRRLAESAYGLGQIAAGDGDLEAAVEHFRKAVSEVPGDSKYTLALVHTLGLLGRLAEAGNFLRTLDAKGPAKVGIAHETALLLIAGGVDDLAKKQLDQTVAWNGATATTYVLLAGIAERASAWEVARQHYLAAVDLDGQSVEAYRGLYKLAWQLKDEPTELNAAERLTRLLPDDGETWRALGVVQRRTKRFEASLHSLLTAQRFAPGVPVQLELARTLWNLGDRGEAVRYYQLAAQSDHGPAVSWEVGLALLETGETEAALGLLERAAEQRPDDPRIVYDLGRALEAEHNWNRALKVYTAACELAHRRPQAHLLLAQARAARHEGAWALARRALAAAVRLDRQNGAAWTEAGHLHLALNEPKLAVRAFRRVSVAEEATVERPLAKALLQAGDAKAAITILTRLTVPDDNVATELSQAYDDLGDRTTALLLARQNAARRPHDPLAQRQLGRAALHAGYIEEALVAFEAAQRRGDNSAETRIDYSQALVQADRLQQALEVMQGTVRDYPIAPVYAQLGWVLLELRNDDGARAAFESALNLNRQLADAWSGLATALEARLGPAKVVTYAQRALQLAPQEARFAVRLTRLLLAAGEPDQAMRVVAPFAGTSLRADRLRYAAARDSGNWQFAREIAQACNQKEPDHIGVAAEYGIALLETGAPKEALPLLERACRQPDAQVDWLESLGRAYIALGQGAAAIPMLERAVAVDPNPETFSTLAEALYANGQVAAAIHTLNQAIALGGKDPRPHRLLARWYAHQGNARESLRNWQLAVALDPTDRASRLAVAAAYERVGDYGPVVDDLDALVGELPNDTEAWVALATAALGAGMFDRACHAAACALEQQPQSVPIRTLLARAEHAAGDTEGALATVRPLWESGEADTATLVLLYQLARAVGNHELARAALELAAKRDRDDPQVVRMLADHLRVGGDVQRALTLLRKLASRGSADKATLYALADHALAARELDEARRAIDFALRLTPDDLTFRRLSGEIAYQAGERELAWREFSLVMQKDPLDGDSALRLGIMALERGEVTVAVGLLQVARGQGASDAAAAPGEAQGWLARALRRPHEPVSEDELPPPVSAAVLREPLTLLQELVEYPHWRAEYGWTLLLSGATEAAIEQFKLVVDDPALLPKDQARVGRRLGLAYLRAEQILAALEVLEVAADKAPDAQTWSVLGQVREAQGDIPLAVTYYGRAATARPDYGLHHLRLGNALLLNGSASAARDHLEQAVKLDPARPPARIALSAAYAALNLTTPAWQEAERAITIDPTNVEAWHHLATLAMRRDDNANAFKAWDKVLKADIRRAWLLEFADFAIAHARVDWGREALRRAATLDPTDSEVWYRLSRLHDGKERIFYLEQAVERNQDQTIWRTELGKLQQQHGQHNAALEHLNRAIAGRGATPEAWVAIASLLRETGEIREAEAKLELGLEQHPAAYTIHHELALLQREQGRWREALSSFNGAIRFADAAADHAGRGECLYYLRRAEDARDAVKNALARDPDHVQALVLAARMAQEDEKWKLAASYASHAREIDDQQLAACCIEAAANIRLEWWAKAEDAIEQGQALAPDLSELHRLRGVLYLAQGEKIEALESAEYALRSDPESAPAYFLLGRVYQAQGRLIDAMTALRKAVTINRGFREAMVELSKITIEAARNGERI